MATRSLVNPKVDLKASATVTNTLLSTGGEGGSSVSAEVLFNLAEKLTSGVSNKQANRAWASKGRTLVNGANEVIDVYDFAGVNIGGGAGNDAVGQAMALEEITLIVVTNDNPATKSGKLEVEPDATNGWTPIGTNNESNGNALGPGCMLMRYSPDEAGLDVTDASSHRVKFQAVDGSVTYSVYIFGRHDDGESSSSSSSSVSTSSSSVSGTSSSSQSSSSSASSQT